MFRVTTSKYQQLSLQIVSRDLRRIVARTTVSISGSDKANTHLFKSLTLDCVDTNNYRASAKSLWRPVGSRFVFGGQVVGQALTAAFNTVQEPLLLHSLHCYFLRGGSNEKPILYNVDRTRDGKTYSSRSIKATQDGVPIFTMQASFKVEETDPLEHQFKMPVVPNPEELISSKDYLKKILETKKLTESQRLQLSEYLTHSSYIEFRPLDPQVYHGQQQGEPRRYVWVRVMEQIGDHVQLQQSVAGCISDVDTLGAARQTVPVGHQLGFSTSIDHSMWFHNPFKTDEWMLYEFESPVCGKGKAIAFGRMWRNDGVLAVSMAQEGLLRTKI